MRKKYVSDSERLKARRARQRITKKQGDENIDGLAYLLNTYK